MIKLPEPPQRREAEVRRQKFYLRASECQGKTLSGRGCSLILQQLIRSAASSGVLLYAHRA